MIAAAEKLALPQVFDVGALSREFATVTLRGLTSAIRAVYTQGQRAAASSLINKRYAWRGYTSGFTVDERPGQMTLVATDHVCGTPIGTLTVRLDGEDGLLAEELYDAEVQRLRAEGHRLCEIVKFAIEDSVNYKPLLAALFHVAFIYAHRLNNCTDLLIEVTPQHASFYRRMLEFELFGEERLNPRVNTRGVLLGLDLGYAGQQISRLGGKGSVSPRTSAYSSAFSPAEERAIRSRMMSEAATSVAA